MCRGLSCVFRGLSRPADGRSFIQHVLLQLEPYMTEGFVMAAFRRMGEQPQSVKVMKNKYSGEPAGYCFVHFVTDEEAINAMHKLNGKVIPKTHPPIRFKLNHAGSTGRPSPERDFSLWVGDLTAEVDDYSLYKTFASRFLSIRAAKVIMDSSGFSKGYGFVRFAKESEQKACLDVMSGYRGLGGKPLKISNAVPKAHRLHSVQSPPMASTIGTTSSGSVSGGYYTTSCGYEADYDTYYDTSYWPDTFDWQGGYYDHPSTVGEAPVEDYLPEECYNYMCFADMEPEDHSPPLDVEALNQATIDQDANLWDALESSKWLEPQQLDEGHSD